MRYFASMAAGFVGALLLAAVVQAQEEKVLNVGMAAAVLCFERARQKRAPG